MRTMSRGHARSLRSGWCCVRGMGGGRRGPCTNWPSGDPVPRQEAQSRRRGQFRKEGAHTCPQVGERGTGRRAGTAEGVEVSL